MTLFQGNFSTILPLFQGNFDITLPLFQVYMYAKLHFFHEIATNLSVFFTLMLNFLQ